MKTIAFLSTSFGFGPVSKAATIASAFRRHFPNVRLEFYGNGIALEFAEQARCFDRLLHMDVDTRSSLLAIIPELQKCHAVVSVLNTEILPFWDKPAYPPLFLVDSLAWMWNERLSGIENVEAYFIQDYLLSDHASTPGIKIPPIDASHEVLRHRSRKNHVLINLSGCYNPFVGGTLYRRYAEVIVSELLTLAHSEYSDIVVCCNSSLADWLKATLGNPSHTKVVHLPHHSFLEALADSARFLTSPGITTTIEAISLEVSPRFLLPQNYSQALIAQRYADEFPEIAGMPLHLFGEQYRIDRALPEAIGVDRVIESIGQILERPDAVQNALRRLWKAPAIRPADLAKYISGPWESSGQDAVASYIAGCVGLRR